MGALRTLIRAEVRLVGVWQSGEALSIDVGHWIAALERMDIVTVEMDVIDAVGTDDMMWDCLRFRAAKAPCLPKA